MTLSGAEGAREGASPRVRRRVRILLVLASVGAVSAVLVDAVARSTGREPLPWSAWLAAGYAAACASGLVYALADRVRRDALRRSPLRTLMMALGILGFGQAIGYTIFALTGSGHFDPRIEVVPSLLCFPFATYALARITWPRAMTPTERRLAALDCVVAVLALAVVWWSVVIPAWVYPEGTDAWQSVDQVLMFAALATTACVGVVSRRVGSLPYPQLARLLAGLSIYFLSDLAGQVVRGADDATSITYSVLGYVTASWLLAAFALRPPLEPEPSRGRRRREQIANLVPVVLALLAGLIVVQAAAASLDGFARWSAMAAWTAVLVGILTARLIAARELSAAQAEGAATVLAVRTREGWFRALVGDSADSVLVLDNGGRVLWTSPRFERDADFPSERGAGWPLTDVLVDLGRSDLALLLTQVSTDPSRSGPYDLLVRSRTGEPLEMEAVIRPITDVEFRGYVVTARDVSDARRLARQLANSRRRDELTGLLSRDAFLAETAHALEHAPEGARVVVLTLDLERFAALNDGLGHETGDQILLAVAAAFDRLPDVVLGAARLGSDTFALLLVTPDPEPETSEVVDLCRESLRGLLLPDGREIEIGFHAGYVVSDPLAGRTAEWHLEAADLALARSRSARHARLVGYRDDMREETERRLAAEERLRRAIAEDRIDVWYQPVHRLSDGVVTGAEALARLRDVDGTVVQPADFIPLAEEIGLIGEIGLVVLGKAVRETARLSMALGHPMHVAVNIAVDQLTPELAPTVARVLAEAGLPASRLSLEITESTLADRSAQMQQVLADLRALGVIVALDDFGTGYSSLSYLSTLPVDGLKIDRSFVSVMGSSRQSLMLARSVVQLGLALDLRTIAEGVETSEQADLLKGMGCDYAQGYFWARPLPRPDYEDYLRGPVGLVEVVEA